MSHKLRLSLINIEQISLMPASERLAHRLLMIAQGYGEVEQARRVLQLPQEDLAAMLGPVAPDHQQSAQGAGATGHYRLELRRHRDTRPQPAAAGRGPMNRDRWRSRKG